MKGAREKKDMDFDEEKSSLRGEKKVGGWG